MDALTEFQMNKLNDEHGWFTYGDAQGDVSRKFANEAVARYLQMAAAGAQMLDALNKVLTEWDDSETHEISKVTIDAVCAAINAAEKFNSVKEG